MRNRMIDLARRGASKPAGLLLVSALLLGCGRDKEPETPYQAAQPYGGQGGYPGTYPVAQGGAAGAGAYGQPSYAGAPTTDPGAAPNTTPPTGAAGAGSSATPIDPGAAAMVQPVINELAKAHTVAGAKPLGSALVGNFQTSQTLETTIQLQPNKCYTIVGTSLPPVTELNVQLVAATPLPGLMPVLAADSETGPTAVVGKKPNCYKWAFPVPAAAKIILQVAAGSGLAAAQIYEK